MSGPYDVIVVGVGTMGAAACDALARRGARVLGLERFGVPNAMGAHHGQSRMFRMAYYEHQDYVPLLKEAFGAWQELERRSGVKLFHVTGGVYCGRPEGELVRCSTESARTHGLEFEGLAHAELSRRYPQLVLPEGYAGIYEPKAGFVVPELAVAAMAAEAMKAGAEIHGQERVLDWEVDGSGVRVETDLGEYGAAKLVVTCGAWSSSILGDLGVKLVVTRQVLGWVWPRRPGAFALGKMPVWAVEHGDGSLHYGFPKVDWHPGFKLARHAKGRVVDPDSLDRRPAAEDEHEFRPFLKRHIPEADGPLLSMSVCTYTNSPDSHFIVDRHPEHPEVSIACGFSGHGFKFAPTIGEVLADLALEGKSPRPVGFLGLHRFGGR